MKKTFTRIMLTVVILITFTGCGSIQSLITNPEYEWLNGGKKVDKGDAPGDICQRCGENYTFIPNEDMGALKEAERQGFTWQPNQTINY